MHTRPPLAPLIPRNSVLAPRLNRLLHCFAAALLTTMIWASASPYVPLAGLVLLIANLIRSERHFRSPGHDQIVRLGQDAAGWWIQRKADPDILPARPESVVVTGLYLRVRWRLDDGTHTRMWLWRDTLADADYRALARLLRQRLRVESNELA